MPSDLENSQNELNSPEFLPGYNHSRQPEQPERGYTPEGFTDFLMNEFSRFLVQATQDTESFANHHLYNPQSRTFYRLAYYGMVFLQELFKFLFATCSEAGSYIADQDWKKVLNNPTQNSMRNPVVIRA